MIGIIGAMQKEVTELCGKMENVEKISLNNLVFHKGTLHGKDVIVVRSGIGKTNAALCAQLLAIKFNADSIINTGIAGAMGEGLKVFDFVVSTGACYHDFDIRNFGYDLGQVPDMPKIFPADNALCEAALSAFSDTEFALNHKIYKGLVASGDQFIASDEKKNFIRSTFNPMCVEMEGAAIAHACYLNKVPFLIVRCMSDTAGDSDDQTYSFNETEAASASSAFMEALVKRL